MNFSVSGLLAGLLFGVLGVYFFRVGRRDVKTDLLAYGLILMIYPFFVTNDWLIWGIGAGVTALCFRSIKQR